MNKKIKITPEIYGYLFYKKYFLHHFSIQLQEYLPESVDFYTFWQKLNTIQEKQNSLKNLADLLIKIHNQAVYLIDINLGNVLVTKTGKFWVIDLDSSYVFPEKFWGIHSLFVSFDLNCILFYLAKITSLRYKKFFLLQYAKKLKLSKRKTKIMFFLCQKELRKKHACSCRKI